MNCTNYKSVVAPVCAGIPAPLHQRTKAMAKEIKLREKYRSANASKSHKKSNHGGNNSHSAGKHSAHPDVFSYRRNGYTCEQKWNRKEEK